MPYATQTDLVERFGSRQLIELTDRTTMPPSTIDATVVSRALADADAEIDASVGKVAALPLASPPAILKRIACDLTHWFLWGSRAEKDTAVRLACEDARRTLADIASGRISLDAAGVAGPAPASGGARLSSGQPGLVAADLHGVL